MTGPVVAGAALGALLGFLGGRVAPRWLSSPLAPWEPYALAAVNGLLTGLLALGRPLDGYFWQHLVFITVLTTASLVDLHDRIIPNELVLFGLVTGLVLLLVAPYPEKSLLQALGGAAAGFVLLLIIALAVPGGMGMGDVKLAAVIGLFLGLPWVGMGMVLAFLAGGIISLLLILCRVVGRKDHIPFGPWLALGAVLTSLYGWNLWVWYTFR
jgi:leader peptidase (prepilin peptidase)/N-methyltransferase